MSITGPGSVTAMNIAAVTNMNNQLNQLSQELSTGEAAQTYSGLGSQAGVALSLNAQLSAITGYTSAATTASTTLSLAQSILTQLGDSSTAVQQSLGNQGAFSLDNNGQTSTQASAMTELDQILSVLNTQVGGNYLFSGNAVNQPSVASTNDILNGNGAQAGLTQVISEREQADEGTTDMGRLNVGGTGANVTLSQDGSPFGFQLSSVNSTLAGATTSGPSGSPPTISVALGSNPNAGDTVQFNLTLPDGSSQTISLQATTTSPPGTGQFTIGANASATATNLQTALTGAITTLAQTQLPAASAVAAANDFFNNDPPLRVSGTPATSMSLVAGTSANTVFWYTGGNSSTPLQTTTAQIGPSTTIAYGVQANEPGISSLIANVAVLAATTYSASNTNAQASYQALSSKVATNLSSPSGTQSIDDIEANLANAQNEITNANSLNTQTQTTLQDMLQNIDGVNQTQVGEQLLTLQNSLSASLSVTARLSQMSLVNYLSTSSG
jgi:flagellar hook-associated protein 3 FlgL